uniref:Reverse transcriptase domain-containing protein n=1 Tax=Tanacetum cinerariifolium TaxID=118510 RepID=A0A6L2LC97_TANCI|nr:hypothetical protein [Tanacetum cinerariifolium]
MSRHTRGSYVGTILTMVMIIHQDSRLSMRRNRATIKTFVIIIIQKIHRVFHNNIFVVKTVGEKTIPLRDIISQLPPSIIITTSSLVLPIEDPGDSLIMGNKELRTIPEKESDEVIQSSVEDFVPIPSESEDTSRSDSECDLPSDDKSLSDKDFPEDNVKIYSNPLFEFDDGYIFSDINPLFDEVLEDIESKGFFYYSNLDEPSLLVTPLFDSNEDKCFDPGGDVDEINDIDIPLDFEDYY